MEKERKKNTVCPQGGHQNQGKKLNTNNIKYKILLTSTQ